MLPSYRNQSVDFALQNDQCTRHIEISQLILLCKSNPLSANPTKWSNTLKQFVGCCRQIVWVVWPVCGVGASRIKKGINTLKYENVKNAKSEAYS